MMILGFCGVGFMAYRRKSGALLTDQHHHRAQRGPPWAIFLFGGSRITPVRRRSSLRVSLRHSEDKTISPHGRCPPSRPNMAKSSRDYTPLGGSVPSKGTKDRWQRRSNRDGVGPEASLGEGMALVDCLSSRVDPLQAARLPTSLASP
jgi:hypothetical protein